MTLCQWPLCSADRPLSAQAAPQSAARSRGRCRALRVHECSRGPSRTIKAPPGAAVKRASAGVRGVRCEQPVGLGVERFQSEVEDVRERRRGVRAATSSTGTGRPSSRAIVVNAASSSPHAVIHSVNGAGSRSTFSAYPCVVTQRETWMPIDAIFRGGRVSQTPVSPSMRSPSTPTAPSVAMSASSRSRTKRFTSWPWRVRSKIG